MISTELKFCFGSSFDAFNNHILWMDDHLEESVYICVISIVAFFCSLYTASRAFYYCYDKKNIWKPSPENKNMTKTGVV